MNAPLPNKAVAGVKLSAAEKVARIPVKITPTARQDMLRKPSWIRAAFPGNPEVLALKKTLREHQLVTVCEEARCPNIGECFSHGTATFMIMGELCTRRCPFCDVGHGRPLPLDAGEPQRLADTIAAMQLKYVVITSVDRDDLRDGGAGHFAACIEAARQSSPGIRVEILVPDFRGRLSLALTTLGTAPPDVFNHNMETVPRLYLEARPGADYQNSLTLLADFKRAWPQVPTKSGLMLGLGETDEEIVEVMRDLRAHQVDMLTLGQYLQPSLHHLPVKRYVTPDAFASLRDTALGLGFSQVASGPMVRSSYHADLQAQGV
ncbi:lipoyl synthase [Herbaspirillum sp. RTI4]|uniref:lipoyl synthase n=1 Tax=Herbaspirillum sp. RTI4 TaxID=3048640 RepID=UPI002AB5B2B4|nr:lipoyl synthase [Herbaspirillum sp. RTI4]MDY7579117.1 lipoyl synthase [Herbaspirillum sp. RTI4]MEA9981304.1 lipoyl synthase [Herbaspirillum sp. RTI4]